MKTKRILLSGGNGYVGRCVAQLLSADCAVCVADSLRYGDWRFSPEERTRLRLEQIDIREPGKVADLMADWVPDIIVHLAALHYIPECEADPALAVSTNVDGTLNLLQAAPAGSRFVFASSGAVYRPQEQLHCEATSEVGPTDIYGFTKLHGEHYVATMAAKRGLRGVLVRLFNVVGPGETNPHLLPELVAQLLAGRDTIELGNLSPRRDYIDVRDAAAGFVAAALGAAVDPGETCVVNLGTSRAYSVSEVVEKLRRISGINFEIKQKTDRIRSIDRPVLAADNRRMTELFSWRQRYTLEDSLAALWAKPDLANGLVEKYR
jgi:UDP-glucose 4-epimerase